MGATHDTSGSSGFVDGRITDSSMTAAELRLSERPTRRVQARAMMVLALAGGLLLQAPSRPTETLDECIRRRVATGETRAVASAACLVATENTTPGSNGGGSISATSSDEGTSTITLLLIGLAGVAVGAVGATLLRRKTSSSPQPAAAAPSTNPAAHMPPPGAAPAATAPPANDRSPGLVTALIDLADRVPSQALRAEILAALGRAGVHPMEPAQGEAFDVSRMRGVGNAPAPDAGWVGRVASTDRVGFHDGASVLRLPEVIVYTAGS